MRKMKKSFVFTAHVEQNISKAFGVSYHNETSPLRFTTVEVTGNGNVTPTGVEGSPCY